MITNFDSQLPSILLTEKNAFNFADSIVAPYNTLKGLRLIVQYLVISFGLLTF